MQVRQAELHTLQGIAKDFNPERRNEAGVFDWSYYLNNIDLRRSIKATDDLSGFSNIKDYTVDPAEIIMPKLYKTQFKLGRHDIAEIDVDFFKKANPFYKSYLKEQGEKVDFLVRTHSGSFNVIITDGNFSDIEATKTLRLIQPNIKDGWRVDSNGNRLYKVPEADF